MTTDHAFAAMHEDLVNMHDQRQGQGMDKKVQHKQLRFVLLQAVGNSHVSSTYDAARLQQLVGASA